MAATLVHTKLPGCRFRMPITLAKTGEAVPHWHEERICDLAPDDARTAALPWRSQLSLLRVSRGYDLPLEIPKKGKNRGMALWSLFPRGRDATSSPGSGS